MKRYMQHKPIVLMFIISMVYFIVAMPALILFEAYWTHCVIALAVIVQFVRTMRYIDNYTEFKIQNKYGPKGPKEIFNSAYDYSKHKYF